ncbi:hypothetical protein [uncultured Sulfitobacter sp.]|uniref:ankyrin repeat domain-containing protein n=1 Tax=uncultured Sulfitobacter sp. TaxID=191468 RepID=UPI002604F3BD|nr:hypothetical protein [uncultured Sulfitobacter sp.]
MNSIGQIIVTVFASLGLSGTSVAAQNMNLKVFFDLVAIGSASEVAQALEREPALAKARDQYDFTAIHMLDEIEFDEKLALLQRFGADVNAQNDQGHALLHFIITPEFIPTIVAAGGDINLRDVWGRTPIMVSLTEPDAFNFLPAYLEAGADPSARDAKGQSVLDYAAAFENPELIGMLVQAGAKQ